MTAPAKAPTLAALKSKARALYREASKIDDELKARGSLMTPFSFVRERRVMAALRPAIEHALLQNRRPSHVAAVLYLEGLKLSMATLYDLGVTMWQRGLGQRGVILADDAAEVGTAQMIAIACVVIASRAKPATGPTPLPVIASFLAVRRLAQRHRRCGSAAPHGRHARHAVVRSKAASPPCAWAKPSGGTSLPSAPQSVPADSFL